MSPRSATPGTRGAMSAPDATSYRWLCQNRFSSSAQGEHRADGSAGCTSECWQSRSVGRLSELVYLVERSPGSVWNRRSETMYSTPISRAWGSSESAHEEEAHQQHSRTT